MRLSRVIVFGCVVLTGATAVPAYEEEDETICASYISRGASASSPNPGVVYGAGDTNRSVTSALICGGSVQSELWISGFNAVDPVQHAYDAHAWDQRLVPNGGTFTANSKHWFVRYFWYDLGQHQQTTNVPPRPPDGDPGDCNSGEGELEEPCGPDSPIVIDVGRNGYDLTDWQQGVRFDLNADGILEQVAWTRFDGDDAFLAMDRNGNGRIDDGSELFGNRTPAYADAREPRTKNGFVALKFLEGPSYGSSQHDFVIDQFDSVSARLVLWTDSNHNGVSESSELKPLSHFGLIRLSTDYKESRKRDRYGNEFRERAPVVWQIDGHGVGHYAYDVWLTKR